jgi:glycosyltransferase involved in cell wall biosynthesis
LVVADLATFRRAHPRAAPITLIEEDFSAAQMRALYDRADCVVCPSRGEGFGLPLAEAAALGVPTLTTAYGGQSDFCTPETSWLSDYSFAPSRSHLGVPGSTWVEPDVESLTRTMVACRDASQEERARRAAAAQRLVRVRYSWDRVAAATREAIATVCRSDREALRLPRIGWVSTWNSRCGIATYSESLAAAIEPERLIVFADRGSAPVGPDPAYVERCWYQGWDDSLDDLHAAIAARAVEAVVIQFNFGFFDLASLGRLLERLKAAGVVVFLFLHSTADVFKPERTIRLTEIAATLTKVDRLFVHSFHDLNRLKAIGLVDNVTLFPHGLPEPLPIARSLLRAQMFPETASLIACFGFLLPHKGVRQLIRAFASLRRTLPKAHLMLLNALYPVGDSQDEFVACRREIESLGLEKEVTLVVDFLSEAEALARLGAADVVIYPYQNTQESASGAIRLGLSSRTPVAHTPLPIFDDVADITYELPGVNAEDIASGLARLLNDGERLASLAQKQARWLEVHSWRRLSRRLADLVRGEVSMQHSWKSSHKI